MNFYLKVTLGVAVLVAVALALVLLVTDSDEAAIEDLLEGGARAAERGDAEAIVALISRDYRAPDETYERVAERVRSEVADLKRYPGLSVKVTGASIVVEGEEADAQFGVKVTAAMRSGTVGFRVRLRKEGGTWKVTSAQEVR